jgi:hypothetical protein
MYEDRVERGAALLDRARPGWEREVSLDRLAMSSCNRCILGQVYGDYVDGLVSLNLFGAAAEYGFSFDSRDTFIDSADLADAWHALIRRRTATAT